MSVSFGPCLDDFFSATGHRIDTKNTFKLVPLAIFGLRFRFGSLSTVIANLQQVAEKALSVLFYLLALSKANLHHPFLFWIGVKR